MLYLRIILAMFFFFQFSLVLAECDPDSDDDCDRPPTVEEIAQQKAEAVAEAKAKLPFKFVEVREVPGMKSADIINNAVLFVTSRFVVKQTKGWGGAMLYDAPKNAKDLIIVNDSENGRLVFDIFKMEGGAFSYIKGINARVLLEAKEGRFRFKVNKLEGMRTNDANPKYRADVDSEYGSDIKPFAYKILNKYLADLHSYLKKSKIDSNW